MTRASRAASAVVLVAAMLALVAPARGGAQLTTRQLVDASTAVARVEVRFAQRARNDSARVLAWLSGAPAAGEPVDATAWFGPCQPSRAVLERWLASHERHPGRATWQRVLRDGGATQVVFLTRRDGALRPVCETESMLGRGYAAHPAHAALRTELDAALRELRASASPR